jgi:hypothetical protein
MVGAAPCVLVALGACSSAPEPPQGARVDAGPGPAEPPPRVCKTPSAAPPFPWFADATEEIGLGKAAGLEPLASTVVAADLDGDGWVDLLAQQGGSQRGPGKDGVLAGKRLRWVLMNRPDPKDPARRVLVDATAESGLLATRDGAGDRGYGLANLGDLDNDGDVDVVLCPPEPLTATTKPSDPCDAFLNDGKGRFALAPESDLGAKVFWVPSAALLDYDRDGVLDFWPATVAHWPYDPPSAPNRQPPTLFRGAGDGTFANVSAQAGLPTRDGLPENGTEWRRVFGVTVCDIDGDGDDDVVFASYGRQENQVWRNDGGRFTNVARELGLDYDHRADYADDQSYRCYCKDQPASCPASVPAPDVAGFCSVFGGKYGRGWMPGVSDQPYSLGGNNFTFACGDIDDDGDMDLMSATIVHGDVGSAADPSELILNPGGPGPFTRPGNQATGLERAAQGIYWNHGDSQVMFVDVDLDGRKDIFLTTTGAYEAGDRPRLWRQKADKTFEEIGVTSGLVKDGLKPNHHGPAFVDVDGDGDLDLVVGDQSGSSLKVYRNLVGQDQNWLRVRLTGKGAGASNASAIGAVVRVTAGGRTQTQHVSGGFGHSNIQSDLVLTFGLGAACDVDKVEVRWPDASGTVASYAGVRANYEVTLREGAKDVEYRVKK